MRDRRYEQTVRVATVFFSALMSFGLKRLLENPKLQTLGNDNWVCAVLTLTLFLRFLFGSANHLWAEYVPKAPQGEARNFLVWDLFWLAGFGFLALRICYANDVQEFLHWNIIFAIAAAVAAPLEAAIRFVFSQSPGKWWTGWVIINSLYGISVYVASFWYIPPTRPEMIAANIPNRGEMFGSSVALVSLVPGFICLLLVDLWFQLRRLDREIT